MTIQTLRRRLDEYGSYDHETAQALRALLAFVDSLRELPVGDLCGEQGVGYCEAYCGKPGESMCPMVIPCKALHDLDEATKGGE